MFTFVGFQQIQGDILEAAERDRLKVQVVRDLLGPEQAQTSADATRNLLGARYCQKGWPDFVKQGSKYSRPVKDHEQRLKRIRLAVAAGELYGAKYPMQNAWCQGPFYYEEIGMKQMSRLSRSESEPGQT